METYQRKNIYLIVSAITRHANMRKPKLIAFIIYILPCEGEYI